MSLQVVKDPRVFVCFFYQTTEAGNVSSIKMLKQSGGLGPVVQMLFSLTPSKIRKTILRSMLGNLEIIVQKSCLHS